MFDTGYRMLGAGARGWSREMIWGERWEGGSGLGTLVHPWLIHVNVWQNQYNIVKQNKVNIKILKKVISLTQSRMHRNWFRSLAQLFPNFFCLFVWNSLFSQNVIQSYEQIKQTKASESIILKQCGPPDMRSQGELLQLLFLQSWWSTMNCHVASPWRAGVRMQRVATWLAHNRCKSCLSCWG